MSDDSRSPCGGEPASEHAGSETNGALHDAPAPEAPQLEHLIRRQRQDAAK
jgi:hypothetical protein